MAHFEKLIEKDVEIEIKVKHQAVGQVGGQLQNQVWNHLDESNSNLCGSIGSLNLTKRLMWKKRM